MARRTATTIVALTIAAAAVGAAAARPGIVVATAFAQESASDAAGPDRPPRPGDAKARDAMRNQEAARTLEGGRDNPFLPQSTNGESKAIAERSAVQQMVRDMMPELRSAFDRSYAHDRQEALDEIRRAAAANQGSRGASNSPRITQTMKLISCINGRALYRDQTSNSTVFAKPGSDQQAPCDPP